MPKEIKLIFSDENLAKLARLQQLMGITDQNELFGYALTWLGWTVRSCQDPNKAILLADGETKSAYIVHLPWTKEAPETVFESPSEAVKKLLERFSVK